jgi:hypothetical protein
MHAPGVSAVEVTVRRRRNVRSTVAAFAVVILAGTGLWAGLSDHGSVPTKRPDMLATAPPSAAPAPSAAPSPSASPSTPAIPGSSSATSTAHAGRSSGSHPGAATHAPTSAGKPTKAPCVTDGIAVAAGTNREKFQSLTPKPEPLCSGSDIKLFYATYTLNPDGSGSLDFTGEAFLTRQHPELTVAVHSPTTCSTIFVGYSWVTIPGAVSPDVMSGQYAPSDVEPFWDAAHDRSALTSITPERCPSAAP